MDPEQLAPETERYLRIMDAGNRTTYTIKLVEDEKRRRHLPGELAFLSKIETEMKQVERALALELDKMGKPVRCPQCGREGLQLGLDAIDCPGCGWKHEY